MSIFLIFCMVLAMSALFGVMVLGIVSMAKGGEFNKKYGNKLMQARVGLQGLALVMFTLAYLAS